MTGGSKSKITLRRTSDRGPGSLVAPSEEDGKIPRKKLTQEQETQLLELTGFSRPQLYNRRGWHSERGLATLLDAGDVIEEIHSTHVIIRTAEGSRQTVYNLERETPFLKKLEP
ncbi:MAG: hypothetical protein FD129_2436 [bacterium]|nr:MAG: hypothetical protein FD129_2436 [bacterium]